MSLEKISNILSFLKFCHDQSQTLRIAETF